MTNTQTSIRATIEKHQRVIMLTVAIVALAAYIVPFAHLYDVADAASKYKDKKNSYDPKKKDSKKDPKKFPISSKASITQSAVLNSGIFVVPGGGGGSGSGYQGTQTQTNTGNFFNFVNQQANICSGTSFSCTNTVSVSVSQQYGQFGGAS